MGVYKEELAVWHQIEGSMPKSGYIAKNEVHERIGLRALRELMKDLNDLRIEKLRGDGFTKDSFFIGFELEGNKINGVVCEVTTNYSLEGQRVWLNSYIMSQPKDCYERFKRNAG